MERFCYDHGGKIDGGYVQNYGYIVETERYRYCLRCNPSPGDYNGYLTAYDLAVQRQNMARDKPLVGRVSYANGDAQEFTDAEAFLKCVREELPYRPTTGFRYEVLTDDPTVRRQVDDMIFDFYKENRFTLKKIIEGLKMGAMGVLAITIVCAASGVIIGVFTVTGLGLKLSSAIVSLAGGNLFALLVLAMIASLVLGMGVPTVAAYLILSILVAPSLIDFGIPAIAAHMYVFYFGIISAITPPVAMAAYVGAGLADAPPVKVGFTACKLAIPAFIVPYILVY